MKVVLSVLLIALSGVAGWFLMGTLLLPEEDTETRLMTSPDGLALVRTTAPAWPPPHKLTMAWLVRLNEAMGRSTPTRLRAWKEDISDWPPMARQFGLALCTAHLQRLAPGEEPLPQSAGDHRRLAAALFAYWRDPSEELPEDVPESLGQWLRAGEVAGVLEAVDHRGNRALHEAVRDHFVRLLAEHDPERALALVSGLSSKRERLDAQGLVVAAWAKQDAEAAMTWLESLPQGRERSALGQTLAYSLDPQVVLEELDRLTAIGYLEGGPRWSALGRWARQDPQAAREWLQQNPDPKLAAAMVKGFQKESPRLAVEMLELVDDFSGIEWTVRDVLGSYLYEDEAAALAWARGLEDDRARAVALMKAADALAYQRPGEARALLNDVMENIGEDNLDVVLRSLASIERRRPGLIEEVGILDRLVDQADSSGNKSSLAGYVDALAANDPEKAAGIVERILAHTEPQEEHSLRIGELARYWLSTDARAAADWFASLPEQTLASSVNTFLNRWARTDPEGAQAWAESNLVPGTKAHGEALPFISEAHMHRGHYDEALKTLQQWPDGEQVPEHLYRNLVKSWHKEDPEAARRAFSSLPVASDLWEKWVER